MKKIYYAHHLWKYNTNIETWEQNLIAKHFPRCEIVNPNGAVEQGRYSEEDIMADCLQLVGSCDALVFSSLTGVIGRGVLQEIEEARRRGLPVYYIHHGKIEASDLHIEELDGPTNRAYATVWIEKRGSKNE